MQRRFRSSIPARAIRDSVLLEELDAIDPRHAGTDRWLTGSVPSWRRFRSLKLARMLLEPKTTAASPR